MHSAACFFEIFFRECALLGLFCLFFLNVLHFRTVSDVRKRLVNEDKVRQKSWNVRNRSSKLIRDSNSGVVPKYQNLRNEIPSRNITREYPETYQLIRIMTFRMLVRCVVLETEY